MEPLVFGQTFNHNLVGIWFKQPLLVTNSEKIKNALAAALWPKQNYKKKYFSLPSLIMTPINLPIRSSLFL